MKQSITSINRPLLPVASVWMTGMIVAIFAWEIWDNKVYLDSYKGIGGYFVAICIATLIIFTIKGNLGAICRRICVFCLIFCIAAIKMGMFLSEHQPFPIEQLHITTDPLTIKAGIETRFKPTRTQNYLQASVQVLDIKERNLLNCRNLQALLILSKSATRQVPKPGELIQFKGTVKKITLKSDQFELLYPISRLNEPQLTIFIVDSQKQSAKNLVNETNIQILRTPNQPLTHIRDTILFKLESVTSSQDVTFLAGLVFGITDMMDPSLQDAYSILGISHLLAVSGMNIELLVRPCLWLLRKIRVWYRAAVLITICMIVFYGLLTDGGPSVVRAEIMGVTMLLSGLFQRKPDPLSALGLSCIICLWIDPTNLVNVGFEFSFLASLFLILFSAFLGTFLKRYKIPHGPAVAVFAAATAATLPIELYVFQQWSPYSIATNLILEPLMPVTMVTLLLVILSCFLCWPLAVVLGMILHGIVWILTIPVKWLFHHGVPILQVQQNEAIWSFAIYGIVAVFLGWGGKIGKTMHMDSGSGKDRNTET
jgi:ComEC/Rec2-related protein